MTAPKIRAGKNIVYWRSSDGKKICATTQRAASAAMAEAFGPAGALGCGSRISMGNAEMLRNETEADIVLWIREPLERMVCAYDIWKDAHTPEEFCAKVLREQNAHWSPTTTLHRIHGDFLPTKIYAFEDLNETWADEFPKHKLRHLGARERMQLPEFMEQVSPEMWDTIVAHYREDSILHELAKASPGLLFVEVAA